MPLLACLYMDVLSGERGAKTEKRKKRESLGRLFLVIYALRVLFLAAQKK